MKNTVGQHIACARASVNERSAKVMQTFRGVENQPRNIVSGQSVLSDSLFDVSRVILSRDVLLLPQIDAASDGG